MDNSEDRKLDELLAEAAPRGPSENLAKRVLAAARRRQRCRCLARVVAVATAIAAVALGVWLYQKSSTSPKDVRYAAAPPTSDTSRTHETQRLESTVTRFPIAFRSTGDGKHLVMMARTNGTYALVIRPSREGSDQSDELARKPIAMMGWVSPYESGPSMAIRIR